MNKEYDYPLLMQWIGDGDNGKRLVVEFTDLEQGIVIEAAYDHEVGNTDTDWIPHTEPGMWKEIPREPLQRFRVKEYVCKD